MIINPLWTNNCNWVIQSGGAEVNNDPKCEQNSYFGGLSQPPNDLIFLDGHCRYSRRGLPSPLAWDLSPGVAKAALDAQIIMDSTGSTPEIRQESMMQGIYCWTIHLPRILVGLKEINAKPLVAQLGSMLCGAIVRIRTRSTLAPSWTTPQRRWRFNGGAMENMPCPESSVWSGFRHMYMYTYVFRYACTYPVDLSFHDVIPLGGYTVELYQRLVLWARQTNKQLLSSYCSNCSLFGGCLTEWGCCTSTEDSLAGILPPEQLALMVTQIQPALNSMGALITNQWDRQQEQWSQCFIMMNDKTSNCGQYNY